MGRQARWTFALEKKLDNVKRDRDSALARVSKLEALMISAGVVVPPVDS